MTPGTELLRRQVYGGAQEIQFHLESERMEQEILRLIEQDPDGAARSWIGQAHLERFGWLLDHGFELKDVLLEAAWLSAQMTAEEYFEEGAETPYTLDAFMDFDFSGKHVEKGYDPFMTYERPDVTMEAHNPITGETVIFNLANNDGDPKPEEGFKEL